MSDISVDIFEEVLLALHRYNGDVDSIRKLGTRLRYTLAYDIGGRNRLLLWRQTRKEDLDQKVLIAETRTENPKGAA